MKSKRKVDRAFLDTFHDMRCIACKKRGCDPAHIKTRGSGGDDTYNNVMPLCRKHHTEQGQIGWKKMSVKYRAVDLDLVSKGWAFDENNKLFLA